MIEKVMDDLNLKEKQLQSFEVEDPFNPKNVLKGFLSTKPDYRYGTIAITHINGQETYQIHFGTPKQHYPFGEDSQFHFPEAKEIEVYEKLDGTNVCAYRYFSGDEQFQTYKLRLFPVLRNSRFGDFLDMWREILEKYPQIPGVCDINGCSVSFEMYGSRNTHLILYEKSLEIALLFGIGNQAKIISPSKLDTLDIPAAKILSVITSQQELVSEYNGFREDIESKNIQNEDETISGLEGVVWYLTTTEGKTIQFKCKPESIEQIHWATGAIDVNTIKATAHNVLETEDKITYEATVRLLEEEFTKDQIELSDMRIRKAVEEVQGWYEFQGKVLELYKDVGISILEDKGAVMREMSKHFSKYQMKKVYTAIMQLGK